MPGIPINLAGYDGVHLVGRALSGLFDLAGVGLIYVVSRRLYSRKVGLVAAALLAAAPLALQQSHFFTVDTFGTFFALVTFLLAVRVAQGGEPGGRGGGWGTYIGLAGFGATIACSINLAPLAGIVLLAAGIRAWDDRRKGAPGAAAQVGCGWGLARHPTASDPLPAGVDGDRDGRRVPCGAAVRLRRDRHPRLHLLEPMARQHAHRFSY